MISDKPRLLKEAWLVLPSKDALKAISIKKDIREDVANKSVSFCADTSRLRSSLLKVSQLSTLNKLTYLDSII